MEYHYNHQAEEDEVGLDIMEEENNASDDQEMTRWEK